MDFTRFINEMERVARAERRLLLDGLQKQKLPTSTVALLEDALLYFERAICFLNMATFSLSEEETDD